MKILNLFCQSRELRQRLERSRGRLYRLAYAWCHEPALADDLVQETLEKGIKRIDQLRDHNALETWLITILSNSWRDYLRRKKDMVDIDSTVLESEITPDDEHQQHEVVYQVREAIAQLPIGQRQIVTLVDIEGCSYVEVATILDIPVGTVMSRLCRARRLLKEKLLATGIVQQQTTEQPRRIRRVK